MKIWIDKQHGFHYHKSDCQVVQTTNPLHFCYDEVEHTVRRLGMPYHKEYGTITIDGRRYSPCPFCFGYGHRFKSRQEYRGFREEIEIEE